MTNLFKWIFLFVISSYCAESFAQANEESGTQKTKDLSPPGWVLKFSPLALIEIPQPSFQIALEYPLNHHFSIQHELGWLPPVAFLLTMNDSQEPLPGGKFKTELRRYLQPSSSLSAGIHNSSGGDFLPRRDYIAVEGLYRVRGIRNRDWQLANNSKFYQWEEWDEYRHNIAFHVKYGIQILLPGAKNVLIDSYIGLGIRQYYERQRYIPATSGSSNTRPETYNYLLPSLSLGFKIGFGW